MAMEAPWYWGVESKEENCFHFIVKRHKDTREKIPGKREAWEKHGLVKDWAEPRISKQARVADKQ